MSGFLVVFFFSFCLSAFLLGGGAFALFFFRVFRNFAFRFFDIFARWLIMCVVPL